MIGKMVAGGMAERVVEDKNLQFGFPSCGELAPPIIMIQRISFRYAPDQVHSAHIPSTFTFAASSPLSGVASLAIRGSLMSCVGRVGVGLW